MIEYNPTLDKITKICTYPSNLKPAGHAVCEYDKTIYIIDGYNGEIISFNPSLNTFHKNIDIPVIGSFPNAITIFNKIHIFNGSRNTKHYLIYDPVKNKIINHKINTDKIYLVSTLKYKNQIIQIGGLNQVTNKRMDTFSMSLEIKDNEVENVIKFNTKQQWKLPIPLCGFGHVLFKNFILIFGGIADRKYLDTIYLLDLKKSNQGWTVLKHTKCPLKSEYLAVLAAGDNIHLFATLNKYPNWKESERGHYSLPISRILGSNYVYDDEENETKCGECDNLQTKLNTIIKEKERQQSLINDLLQNQSDAESKQTEVRHGIQEYQVRLKQSDDLKNEYMQKYQTIKQHEVILRHEKEKLQTEINKLNSNLNESQIEKARLQTENNVLKSKLSQIENENNELSEECKCAQMELQDVKQQLKELKRLHLDPKDYLNWSSDDVVHYICTLDQGCYEKYAGNLRVIFAEEAVDGQALVQIDKPSLRDWGINNFKHRANIYDHFQRIVNQNNGNVNINNNNNNNNNIGNEGKPSTAFIG